jgi:hypothetical protein
MPMQPTRKATDAPGSVAGGSWANAVETVNWRLTLALVANMAVWAQLSELIVGLR